MKYRILLSFVAAAILIGCSSSNNSTGTTQGSTGQILRIQYTNLIHVDTTQHIISSGMFSCSAASLDTFWTRNYANFYALRSDSLYYWYSGECTGSILVGSKSLYGTWRVLETNVSMAPVDSSCARSDTATPVSNSFVTTYTFTSTTFSKVNRANCLMDAFISENSFPKAKKISCTEASVTDSLGNTATLNFVETDTITAAITETLVYNGKTCTATGSLQENSNPTASLCVEAWANYQKANPGSTDSNYYWPSYTSQGLDTSFSACVTAAGFHWSF